MTSTAERRAANTAWIAKELARCAACQPRDVGYAGLKDRHAAAVQWFSVPAARVSAETCRQWSGAQFRVLAVRANRRKLQRGALRGNRFHIRLRQFSPAPGALAERLQCIAAHGVANYFGPQRFGHAGANLQAAADWADGGAAPGSDETD